MKYFSEKLNRKFDTVEDCEKAERDYDEAIAKAKAEKEARDAGRKAAAKEVEDALKTANAAYEDYRKKLSEFNKQYGSWHVSVKDTDPWSVFDLLMRF